MKPKEPKISPWVQLQINTYKANLLIAKAHKIMYCRKTKETPT